MVLDTQGYILTNSHVVMDGTVNSIKVLLSTGEEVDGRVVWNDASLDLAIVKIEAEGLSPVELGNSDEVAIGSYVAAIGNPLGLAFNGSITQGVVSGLDRTITVSDEMGSNVVKMEGLIQVDAAINGGNSGGPLLNSKGQVIGVNTAKAQAEGMGFAIPINTAIPIVEKVIRDGSFERVYMGVSAADVSVIKENYPNVVLLADSGAVITDVNPGSPAQKAGLKVKDVIISVDGKDILGSSQLIKMLLGYESGDSIRVVYLRDGEEQTTNLTLVSASELNQIQEEENPFMTPPKEESRGQSDSGSRSNPFGW
jgi:S1-C subfamily serine protease